MDEINLNPDNNSEDDNKPIKPKIKIPVFLIFLFDLIKLVAIAFLIVWPIHYFIFQPFYVVGPSMEPNFYDKDYLIITKINYRFNSPQRGEVVIFKSPINPKDFLIKRVIGLPGEQVIIKSGKINIHKDNQEIELKEEDYLPAGITTLGEIDATLKSDEYYVLGDNRNMSLDSRVFGQIKKSYIVGQAWFRGWPLNDFGFIKTSVFANHQ